MEQPQWYNSMVQPLWKTVLISHEATRWPWNPSQVFNLEKWKLSFHKACSSLLMQFYSESPQTGYNPHVILGYWVNKWKHPCREYYSATKRNKLSVHATTYMNLQRIMLHEKSQSSKLYNRISFIYHSWNDKIIERKNILVFPSSQIRSRGRKEWVWLYKGNMTETGDERNIL